MPNNQNVELGKDQLDAIAVLGYQLYEQGKARDAEVLFNGLISIDQGNYFGYAGLGALALGQEKLDEAVEYLSKAAEINPADPSVHANLGEAYLRQAKFNEAAAQFSKALELDPEERDPGANRARAILDGMEILVSELSRMQAAQPAH